jgi:hypothetical protein
MILEASLALVLQHNVPSICVNFIRIWNAKAWLEMVISPICYPSFLLLFYLVTWESPRYLSMKGHTNETFLRTLQCKIAPCSHLVSLFLIPILNSRKFLMPYQNLHVLQQPQTDTSHWNQNLQGSCLISC